MKSAPRRLLMACAALLLVASAGVVVLATRPREPALEKFYAAPGFSLTDQDGKPFASDALRGKVWIAMVFFTQCPGICPMMTARIADVQKSVPSKDVWIVSFSLDSKHDSPEAMKAFANKLDADQGRWRFLTGPEEQMYDVARQLKLAAQPAMGSQPIVHSTKVLLIDRHGIVRGIYDTDDEQSLKTLTRDAQALAEYGR